MQCWHDESNYIVVLEVDNQEQLQQLIQRAGEKNLKLTEFHEPDMGNSLTAVVFHPSEQTQKFLRNLRLAG